jgi:hypothetical protein
MNLFSPPAPMTVGDLTRYIRELFEVDYRLQDIWVEGEVSGVTRHTSGHIYFTLKDSSAQIACVMWKTVAPMHGELIVHGRQIAAHGKVSVYEPRGSINSTWIASSPKAWVICTHSSSCSRPDSSEGCLRRAQATAARIPHRIGLLIAHRRGHPRYLQCPGPALAGWSR